MARIYVDFGGLQELQNKMSRIVDGVNDLENEITRSANRLDWEVSQKRSIDGQIHRARRKAARLVQKAEQMQRFLVRANAEFSRTDLKCAREQKNITYNLESVWKGFLGLGSRAFSEIGQYGAEVLEALKNAGYYFLNGVIDFKKAQLGAINTAVGFGSLGVAPIAPFVVSGALKERIGAVYGGGQTKAMAVSPNNVRIVPESPVYSCHVNNAKKFPKQPWQIKTPPEIENLTPDAVGIRWAHSGSVGAGYSSVEGTIGWQKGVDFSPQFLLIWGDPARLGGEL